MKKLLSILSIFFCLNASATTYYISTTGANGNSGLSAGFPWQTLPKVNATPLTGGDSVLFKRGDNFYGFLKIIYSGSVGNPIYYGAYGSGVNPIITGFTTVGAWTNIGTNFWESTSAISTLDLANVVTVNGVSVAMGRTPNASAGYAQFQSHSTNVTITSSALTGTPNWTGAELAIRFTNWIVGRDSIVAQSGSTLTYTAGTGLPYVNGQAYSATDNWGYFIQNDPRTCDTINEWYYKRSTKKLDIYSVGPPSGTVKVSTIDTLVNLQQHDNIKFENLQITGGNSFGFYITKAKNITIVHCKLDLNYDGVMGKNFGGSNLSSGLVFTQDTIMHTSNKALDLPSEFSSATVSNNYLRSSGALPGMGGSGDGQYQGINVTGSGTFVQYNEVDSTGYVAIGFRLSNINISYNYIHNYCFVKDDGGGIYYQGAGTGNMVSYNTVINGIGALNGTGNGFPGGNGVTKAHGIYFDDLSSGGIIKYNTVGNNSYSGIYLHNANNVQVLNNTSYNSGKSSLLIGFNSAVIRNGLVVKNNIFFQKDSTGQANFQNLCFTMSSIYNDLGSILTMDSNYFARPINDSLVFDIDPTGGGGSHHFYTLATWQSLYGYDAHSHKSPKTVTTTSDIRFDYNQTGSPSPVILPDNFIDVTSSSFNGSILLAPYSSAVLIKNTIPNPYQSKIILPCYCTIK
jgi:parallel beta-helix repeat protein